jgi:DNA-binding NarL/FixJ family response regulator
MQVKKKPKESIEAVDVSVLLIEDSLEDGVTITKALFESEMFYYFNINRKYTLAGGLEMLKTGKFDVVLLDLGLPDARGLKAVKEIHKLYPELPIVIISGYSSIEMIQEALTSGAQEFLVKGDSSAQVIRQGIYQAIARKKIELSYQKGEKI